MSNSTESGKKKSAFSQALMVLGSAFAWIAAIGMVAAAVVIGLEKYGVISTHYTDLILPPVLRQTESASVPTAAPLLAAKPAQAAALPVYSPAGGVQAVARVANPHTIIPSHPREEVEDYRVEKGDSIFSIARKFSLKPETILWANYDLLNDNPDMIAPGVVLKIPAVDGVYHKWKEGETLENVAAQYKAKVQDILAWAPNRLDQVNPVVKAGTYIMVPGGKRESRQWVIPVIPRGKSGVLKTVLGSGACDSPEYGALGTGSFVWPAPNHFLSGNDYWSGHLGIDIATGLGTPIFAADTGVVVFAGWANGGYGNTIVIDHGNGYQTLYAHLNSVGASCGSGVIKGGTIAGAGSTGNSTGPHLHFEVRFNGGFISPWTVLP
ncbi:MAG TPA: M23 family metallopeptidase [Anaerolineaceae bacterium]